MHSSRMRTVHCSGCWGGGYPSMHWVGGVYPSMHWVRGFLPIGVCPGEGCLPAVKGTTGVKTLPCRNYVADGNKPLQRFDVTPLTQSVDTPRPLVAQDSASVSQKTFRSSARRWRTRLTSQGPSSPRCRWQNYYKATSTSEEVSTQVVTSRFRKELEDISPFFRGN